MNRRWEWLEKMSQWPGWRLLGALAVVIVVGVVFYIGITVHQHNDDLDCMQRLLNQVLNEAVNHAKLHAPACYR